MARTGRPSQLKPGESNVESANIVRLDNGKFRMQWDVRLNNGRLKHCKIEREAKRKMDIREQARRRTEEKLLTGGVTRNGGWKRSSDMGRFVDKVVIAAVEANGFAKPLRPTTQERYVTSLRLFSAETAGIAIGDAVRPKVLRPAFANIAREHGTATARKCASIVSKYVMRRLVSDEIIDHDPLRDLDLELPEKVKKRNKGGTRDALTPAEHTRCVDWLAALDPDDMVTRKGNGQGRWNDDVRRARWAEARDVTLVQATCGLRINEALSLERRDVGELLGHMSLTIRLEVSKTHKERCVPVTDERVSEAVRRRLDDIVGPKATSVVFGSPAAPEKPWDRSNAHKTMRALYDRMADELSIPMLHELSTHSWRKTLNTEWMERGVPAELRAEFFGHNEEENKSTYTDVRHTAELLGMLGITDDGDGE